LRSRGVLDETFIAHRAEIGEWCASETIAKKLKRDLYRTRYDTNWSSVSAILWFPLCNLRGDIISYLARPLPNYNGQKLLAPNKSNGEAWIPRETFAARKDVTQPLVITEGPVKGMVLAQCGALPIALQGVWMAQDSASGEQQQQQSEEEPPRKKRFKFWNDDDDSEAWKHSSAGQQPKRDEKLKLRDEFSLFSLLRRRVYVCLDADHKSNAHVRQAEIRLAFLLHAAGVDVLQLCTWDLKDGKGVDDYIAAKAGLEVTKQKQVLKELIDQAKPFVDDLDSFDIPTVKKELHRVDFDSALFAAFAKRLASKLGATKKSLGAYDEDDKDAQTSGAESIDIPPTAEPWGDAVIAEEVLDEICVTIDRFVWLRPQYCRAVALWIVLTYLHDAVDILPLLVITAPEENCGKTTLLELVYALANRPAAASNISSAAIYRTIKDDLPTLTLDEVDTFMKDEHSEMRGIIDSGHKRTFAYVIRMINDKGDTGKFSTWCPKALARIGLPNRTILSRAIHIRMDRKKASVKRERFIIEKHLAELAPLRRKISRLANDIRPQVKAFEGDDTLINRANDNWRPLFAIAIAAGEGWSRKALASALRMSGKDEKDSKSFGRSVLEAISRIIADQCKIENLEATTRFFLPTTELLDNVSGLNSDAEAPWMEKKDGLTPRGLANVLKAYQIKPHEARDGKKVIRGYWSDELEKAIAQYTAHDG
jgi:hypothetical protein